MVKDVSFTYTFLGVQSVLWYLIVLLWLELLALNLTILLYCSGNNENLRILNWTDKQLCNQCTSLAYKSYILASGLYSAYMWNTCNKSDHFLVKQHRNPWLCWERSSFFLLNASKEHLLCLHAKFFSFKFYENHFQLA